MAIVMVKKRLADGGPCKKCVQAEDLLRRRGLWERIDRVAMAVEGEPDSEGYRLARELGVNEAPFFVVDGDGGGRRAFRTVIELLRSGVLGESPGGAVGAAGAKTRRALTPPAA